jgi:hypothetical protein
MILASSVAVDTVGATGAPVTGITSATAGGSVVVATAGASVAALCAPHLAAAGAACAVGGRLALAVVDLVVVLAGASSESAGLKVIPLTW